MAYTPINWQTGDTITAEKMNKMDNGWGVESSSQTLFNETVTTTVDPEYPEDGAWGDLAYSTLITADTLTVTFGGTDYTCPRIDLGYGSAYGGYVNGAPDFTNFPFAITSSEFMGTVNNDVATATSGTYTISASSTSSAIEISDQFRTVVENCVDTSTMPMLCVSGTTTYADMTTAFVQGKLLFFRPYSNIRANYIITSFSTNTAQFLPENSAVSATFTDGVFTVTIQA